MKTKMTFTLGFISLFIISACGGLSSFYGNKDAGNENMFSQGKSKPLILELDTQFRHGHVKSGPATIERLYMDNDKLQIASIGPKGNTHRRRIIRKDLDVQWDIDDVHKSYTEMSLDANKLKKIGKGVSKLINPLSGAGRKNNSQQMGTFDENESQVVFKIGERGKQIKEWVCDEYVAYVDDLKLGTWCVVSKDILGIKDIPFEVKKSYFRYRDRVIVKKSPNENETLFFSMEFPKKDVFPVQCEINISSNDSYKMTLREVSYRTPESGIFQLSQGYRKITMAEILKAYLFGS